MFIILGIIIIIAGILFFIIQTFYTSEQVQGGIPKTELLAIQKYVELCAERELTNAIVLLALQGGRIYPEENVIIVDTSPLSLGFEISKSLIPSIDIMEEDLERYMENVLSCNFSTFENKGLSIDTEIPTLKISINNDQVSADLIYPLSLTRLESSTRLSQFKVSSPIRLGYVYSVMRGIVAATEKNPDAISLSDLANRDLNISIIPYNDTVLLYSIGDVHSEEKLLFVSAFIYDPNTAPEFVIDAEYVLRIDTPFNLDLKVFDKEGDAITYIDDSVFFDINDGKIAFTPRLPGEYLVAITVEDSKGMQTRKQTKFVILK